jgi:hypothetical protein
VYTHHGRAALFEGILSKRCRVQANGDKNKQQIVSAERSVGARIRVYYVPNQTSDELESGAPSKVLLVAPGDAKRLFNLIFLVDFLPEEGESRTGSVVSTNDSTREITLAATDGSKRENFVGVLPRSYGFQNPSRHKDYGSFFRRNDWTGTGQDASLLAVRPANEVSGV